MRKNEQGKNRNFSHSKKIEERTFSNRFSKESRKSGSKGIETTAGAGSMEISQSPINFLLVISCLATSSKNGLSFAPSMNLMRWI